MASWPWLPATFFICVCRKRLPCAVIQISLHDILGAIGQTKRGEIWSTAQKQCKGFLVPLFSYKPVHTYLGVNTIEYSVLCLSGHEQNCTVKGTQSQ